MAGKALSRLQHSGAVLEAAGLSAAAVARILDVKETTVSIWKRSDLYLKAVDEYGERADEEIGPIIARARAEAWALHDEALGVIKAAMKATTKLGDPAHTTRLAGAQTLERYIRLHLQREGPSEGGPSASATLIVHVDADNKIVSKPKDPAAIEGTAEEMP